jgi:eukaryotic-like serine/threonine-protein kinase
MTMSSGARLGPYEILSKIGAGGMGEVYRAKDTRLDRTVAIKVLPSQFSSDPQLKQRFEREARTISSLSHPYICALYDVGHQEGIDFLVMEFLEGETLAERLRKSALPLDQVLRYGVQIADALDTAHKLGVIHRDLKPGNIMLTRSGVKLLDFGLAKLADPVQQKLLSGVSVLPTEQQEHLTAEGTILGTIQYMSPEQLEAKETDGRTDIFAFGSVLYEMATGRKAFTGKSQASLISSILKDEPAPISTIQPLAPPALDRVVKTCLAKDPDDRWQTAHDVMLELKWIAEGGSQTGLPVAVGVRRRSRERIAWLLAAIFFAVALAFVLSFIRSPKQENPVIRFSIQLPESKSSGGLDIVGQVAISTNGRNLVFVGPSSNGKSMLWLRPLETADPRLLTGTEGASFPFWSPDNRYVGFFAEGRLKKIDVMGGFPETLCDATDARGGAWSRNGKIVFAPHFRDPLYEVSAAGGTSRQLTTLDKTRAELSHRWPQFLPDGIHFLYLSYTGGHKNDTIYMASLDSKDLKPLLRVDSNAVYASGHLFFVRDPALMAQPFDLKKMQLIGEPFQIQENIGRYGDSGPTGYAPFSVSQNSVLAFGRIQSLTMQPAWFDRAGKELETVGPPGLYSEPSLSPDGKRIAIDVIDPKTNNADIWILDLLRRTLSRFTFDSASVSVPSWSPDGTKISFCSSRLDHSDIYVREASGAGDAQILLKSDVDKWADDWSPDGRYIVFENSDPKNKFDLWVLPMFGDRKPFPILQTEFNESHSQVSPDGRWIAYTSDETGRAEVFVRSFPKTTEGKWQISVQGGDTPQWRPDGKELFYFSADKNLMSVEINSSSSFEASAPAALFEAPMVPDSITGTRNQYFASPDGQRFFINKIAEKQKPSPITVVINWPAQLQH